MTIFPTEWSLIWTGKHWQSLLPHFPVMSVHCCTKMLKKESRRSSKMSYHFTCDHWTSKNNDTFQSLTLHYVTDDWCYRKWTVNCKNMEGHRTGEAIAAMTDSMIWEISGLPAETFKMMTTDAASNMLKAMRESATINSHLRCIDHVINTCVQVPMLQNFHKISFTFVKFHTFLRKLRKSHLYYFITHLTIS